MHRTEDGLPALQEAHAWRATFMCSLGRSGILLCEACVRRVWGGRAASHRGPQLPGP